MSFAVAADSYDRFMGRFSSLLAPGLADFAGVREGQRVLDVGCGPGALIAELVPLAGSHAVAAVDPSEPFVAAARERYPEVDVRLATAESLPFEDDEFDAALAQLVVHFMADPVAGLAEMARVTRGEGVVAASVWDFGGERAPISAFWRAALDLNPEARDESGLAGARAGALTDLLEAAGLQRVEETELAASIEFESFDDWWEPFRLGVGPAGGYAKSLGDADLRALRERCRELLPDAPFTLEAVAWAARGAV